MRNVRRHLAPNSTGQLGTASTLTSMARQTVRNSVTSQDLYRLAQIALLDRRVARRSRAVTAQPVEVMA